MRAYRGACRLGLLVCLVASLSVYAPSETAMVGAKFAWNFAFGSNMDVSTRRRRQLEVMDTQAAVAKGWELHFSLPGKLSMEVTSRITELFIMNKWVDQNYGDVSTKLWLNHIKSWSWPLVFFLFFCHGCLRHSLHRTQLRSIETQQCEHPWGMSKAGLQELAAIVGVWRWPWGKQEFGEDTWRPTMTHIKYTSNWKYPRFEVFAVQLQSILKVLKYNCWLSCQLMFIFEVIVEVSGARRFQPFRCLETRWSQ